ncbi:MAG: hypothetical protein E7Z83_02100 [Methanobrevibacter sp.]|nr:right-handed parallel beta-helix repeat-containing protein [Methanobrevibacter sp.]MBE6489631.1 hypothetical protein [Methanobrevibacter sp.]
MKYKLLILLSIFIISISAVSAENINNQTIGEIDDSIDINDNILLENTTIENTDSEANNSSDITTDNATDVENNETNTKNNNTENQTDIENNNTENTTENQTIPENETPAPVYPDGTFAEFEKILWRASDGDTIILDRNYNYDGSDRKVMGIYRQLTIDGAGHTLDGKNGARIFYVGSDVKTLTLKNIIFKNGKINGAGGAILNDGARLTIDNCSFINNRITGTTGGAIASNNVNYIRITNSKFSGNYATGVGGAISITGNYAEISNCTFSNNEARDNLGGAILVLGNSATVKNNAFTNNKAGRDGGAVDIEGKTVGSKCQGATVSGNTFTQNTAVFGGALGLNGKDSTIENNVFTSNNAINSKSYSSAGIGGAMRVMGEKNIKVINNTFTDNTAYRQGGAFYLEGASSVISKNTFTNNKATTDAGGSMNLKGNGIRISENTITGSSSKNSGGAIFVNGNNLKITDNKISQAKSTASYGGAMQVRGDAATITGNEFTQNTAKSNGGALYVMSEKAIVTNNNFNKNKASKGLAIYAKGDSPKLTGNKFIDGKTTNTLVWDKLTTKLTAGAKTFKKSVKTKKYTITLKNDMGKVVKNVKVTLKVNKKTYSAKTNSKGQITFKITNLNKKGKFTAIVKFSGNKYHYAVTKKPKITIK